MEPYQKITPAGEATRSLLNPVKIAIKFWHYRELIKQLTWREVAGRYKGSWMGLGWAFIHPIIMLFIYTFVFSVIFNARWGMGGDEGKASFAIGLFLGLITFGIFSETINAAPMVILSNTNLVKKVVFPLEILPFVKLCGSLAHASFSLSILLMGMLWINHSLPWTLLLLPLIWFPLFLLTLGLAYFLASLGVFVRDTVTVTGIMTMMLFFLSPVFYPVQAVPESFRFFFKLNPLALYIEDARRVALWGAAPDWPWYLANVVLSVVVFSLGLTWFMKTKKGFADVL